MEWRGRSGQGRAWRPYGPARLPIRGDVGQWARDAHLGRVQPQRRRAGRAGMGAGDPEKAGYKDGSAGVAKGEVEVFPKQGRVAEGKVGGHVALPFRGGGAVLLPNDQFAMANDPVPMLDTTPADIVPAAVERVRKSTSARPTAGGPVVAEGAGEWAHDDAAEWDYPATPGPKLDGGRLADALDWLAENGDATEPLMGLVGRDPWARAMIAIAHEAARFPDRDRRAVGLV